MAEVELSATIYPWRVTIRHIDSMKNYWIMDINHITKQMLLLIILLLAVHMRSMHVTQMERIGNLTREWLCCTFWHHVVEKNFLIGNLKNVVWICVGPSLLVALVQPRNVVWIVGYMTSPPITDWIAVRMLNLDSNFRPQLAPDVRWSANRPVVWSPNIRGQPVTGQRPSYQTFAGDHLRRWFPTNISGILF